MSRQSCRQWHQQGLGHHHPTPGHPSWHHLPCHASHSLTSNSPPAICDGEHDIVSPLPSKIHLCKFLKKFYHIQTTSHASVPPLTHLSCLARVRTASHASGLPSTHLDHLSRIWTTSHASGLPLTCWGCLLHVGAASYTLGLLSMHWDHLMLRTRHEVQRSSRSTQFIHS